MDTPKPLGRGFSSFIERLRRGRLSATVALLAVLSAGILLGSVATGKVSGKESQRIDSTDARPLALPNPVTLSNGFSAIVKQVGPAVVNINTDYIPKQRNPRNRRALPNPNQPQPDGGDDDDQNNDMQDFLNRFFGGNGGGGQLPEASKREVAACYVFELGPSHVCRENAVPYTNSGGALGHGFECSVCGAFLQAG